MSYLGNTGLGDEGVILKKEIIIPNDQILTMPTVGIELVPAPGDGNVILLDSVTAILDSSFGSISSDSLSSFSVIYGPLDYDLGTQLASGVVRWQTYLSTPNRYFIYVGPPLTVIGDGTYNVQGIAYQTTLLEDAPLLVADVYGAIPNYTGGDDRNTLKVVAHYTISKL